MGSNGSWAFAETAWLQEGHRQPIYCGTFNHLSPQLGNLLATVGGCRATIYRCEPGGELEALQVYSDADSSEEFFACAWSLDAATGAPLLLLAGKKGLLLVIDALAGVLVTCLEGHGSAINDIAVHPTSPHFVVTASRDHGLRLWNLRTRCCVLVFQGDGGHRNEVLTLSWKAAPTGHGLLLSAGMDSQVKVWGLDQHEHVLAASEEWAASDTRAFPAGHVTMPLFSTERTHWNYVDCVRWLGDFVLSKSVGNRIVVWRPDPAWREPVTPAAAAAGRARPGVDTAPKDGGVELVQELHLEECGDVWWLRFALDYWCGTLAIGTATGRVLVYDPHAPQAHPKAKLRPKRAAGKEKAPLVRQTAVSHDGSIIVSCHEDGSLTRYDRLVDGAAGAPAGAAAAASAAGGGSPSDAAGSESE